MENNRIEAQPERERKPLDEAIGCWTNNADYNALFKQAARLLATAQRCRTRTRAGNPDALRAELILLEKQVDAMRELTSDTIRRCRQIISTGEVVTPEWRKT